MHLQRPRYFIAIVIGVVASAAVPTIASDSFTKDIRPALDTYCLKCHNAEKKKANVEFSSLTSDSIAGIQRKLWRKSLEQLQHKDMPPEGEREMPEALRQKLVLWMKSAIDTIDPSNPLEKNPGPALIHRLTRTEYNLTIRDLVGINFDSGNEIGMPDEGTHGFSNIAAALNMPPSLMEKYFASADVILERVIGPAEPNAPAVKDPDKAKSKKAFETIFFLKPSDSLQKREAAKKVIERFARLAFRRPPLPEEISRQLSLFDKLDAKGATFENSVRGMLKSVLVSPYFLFRIEEDRAAQGSKDTYKINDYELASRLSYFIWSSMPDEALFTLAEQKKLSDPQTLEQQIKRMLADPKARALTDNFAVQWLQLKKLADARPSTEFFPTFNQKLRQAMYDETSTFFDKLREEDRSIVELLDADYTYANQTLAKHYGLNGVTGDKLQRVALKPGDHRGGLLGMGSILAMTSHTSRTSPSLRGKYILEVLFGTPPPPPPANVGMIKDENKKNKTPETFREQLARHASDASCAVCHKKIDPLGFALDNYDAIGSWRETVGGKPLDTTGVLPTGEKLGGSADLKQVVLKRRDEVIRNFIEQMMTYALGREIQDYDEGPVREVLAFAQKNEYRFSSIMLGIAKSYPFQNRRNTDSTVADSK